MTQDNKPLTCPLCQRSNACAMASGSGEPCWCMSGELGPLTAAIPQNLPADRCICPDCARRLLAASAGSPERQADA